MKLKKDQCFIIISLIFHSALILGLGYTSSLKTLSLGKNTPSGQVITEVTIIQKKTPNIRLQPKSLLFKSSDILISKKASLVKPILKKQDSHKKQLKQQTRKAVDVTTVNLSESQTRLSPQMQDYMIEFLQKIEANKHYPKKARRLRQTGEVQLSFHISPDGNILDVQIKKKSRYISLNKAALSLIKKLGAYKPPPNEIKGILALVLPVSYEM